MTRTKTRTAVAELPGQASLFGPETRTLTVRLAGLTKEEYRYFNALRAAKKNILKSVTLRREPRNPHDANAIRVRAYTIDNEQLEIGFIPARIAAVLAPLMDSGIYITADKNSYRAWRPDKTKPRLVVAELTLSWTESRCE